MEINKKYKWTEFETEFISFVENNVGKIYATSLNESEASLITLENKNLVLNRFVNKNGDIATNSVDEFKFDSIKDCLKYLRLIKEDHANNYDYKDLVKKLISQLYMNNHIKPEDIISQ
jgi:hypothetical protein